jgi:hypothetical protein
MSKQNNLKPPIFLIGSVRSGTTMFHHLFNLHEDIESWFEPRTIWMYANPGRKYDQFTADDATSRVTKYIRKRFLQFQKKHGNRRIMEKTPSNTMRVPYVEAIFPESKMLYIIREPFANLSSAELRWQTRSNNWHHLWVRLMECPKTQLHYYIGRFLIDNIRRNILRKKHFSIWGVRYKGIYDELKQKDVTLEELICKQWVECSKQADEDLSKMDPSKVMRIRYEDFVQNPVEMYRDITDFFNLELTEKIESQIKEMVDPGRQDKWKRLDIDVLRRCYPILKDEMQRHGYETDEIEKILSD